MGTSNTVDHKYNKLMKKLRWTGGEEILIQVTRFNTEKEMK